VNYINPESGKDAQNNLGFYALMLRAAQTLVLPARSPSAMYHTIEGHCEISITGLEAMQLAEADTCVVPGYRRSGSVTARPSRPHLFSLPTRPRYIARSGFTKAGPDRPLTVP
jgi:gentisate 1,2-dioxygenase